MRRFNEKFLTKFGSLAKRNLWEIFADMEYMLKDDSIKETANSYLFGLLPFACFAGKFDMLLEQLEKDVDKLPKDFIRCFMIILVRMNEQRKRFNFHYGGKIPN